jgi:hypothetical protein
VGVSGKMILRNVASYSAWGVGLDAGARFRLAPGVVLAATLRDVTTTPVVWDTGTTDRIQPSLALGVGLSRDLAGGRASLAVGSRAGGDAADDAGTTPLNAGIEYSAGRIDLRAGLDEERQTWGLGIRLGQRLDVDVAWLQHDELEGTYLVSATVGY